MSIPLFYGSGRKRATTVTLEEMMMASIASVMGISAIIRLEQGAQGGGRFFDLFAHDNGESGKEFSRTLFGFRENQAQHDIGCDRRHCPE